MIAFIGWLAALVALLTGIAKLSELYLNREMRQDIRSVLAIAFTQLIHGGIDAAVLQDLQQVTRLLVRIATKLGIVGSSFVCVLMPMTSGQLTAGTFEVALRSFLAVHMATQVPCPWLTYVFSPRENQTRRKDEPRAD